MLRGKEKGSKQYWGLRNVCKSRVAKYGKRSKDGKSNITGLMIVRREMKCT